MDDDSARLKRVRIERVAEALGLPVSDRGSRRYTRCPISAHEHDDVRPRCELGGAEPHLWHCHKCAEGGDVVGLVRAVRGCDAAGAFEWLRARGFLPPRSPDGREAPPPPATQELAGRRDWDEDVLQHLGVQAHDGLARFPMRDGAGQVVGWKLRRGDGGMLQRDGGEVKSATEAGGHQGLIYAAPLAPKGRVLLLEGEADWCAASSAGAKRVVATPGASVGRKLLEMLAKLLAGREVYLAPHPDEAGRKWRERVTEGLLNAGCRLHLVPPGRGDLDDRLRRADDVREALRGLLEVAKPWPPAEWSGTALEKCLSIMGDCTFFSSLQGDMFAKVPAGDGRERVLTVATRGGQYRSWLVGEYAGRESTGRPPHATALRDAMELARARARAAEPRAVHLRVARAGERLYLDLGGRHLEAVEIDGTGYRVVPAAPVEFWRSDGMGRLPVPDGEASDLALLEGLLNVPTRQDLYMAVAWLLGCLQPGSPYPLLLILGEAGATKSSATRLLRSIVDPAGATGRSVTAPPREGKDLFAVVRSRHVLAIDNVSAVPQWLSDLLSSVATGGGQDTRQLYTDHDLTSVDAQRPILVNGIEVRGLGEDLVDRSIVLNLTRPAERVPEVEYWARVEEAWPTILGGLCDAASCALRRLPEVREQRGDLSRMADFAQWIAAAEPALHEAEVFADLDFAGVYAANRRAAGENVLEASVIGKWLMELAEERWQGTAGEMLAELEERAGERTTRLRAWPKTASSLGKRLTRLAPALREAGYHCERERARVGTVYRLGQGTIESTIQGEIPF
ncbi:MAG: toprim domain-containing protein [Armatimonadota bacterium]|jgi:hypothetical protein